MGVVGIIPSFRRWRKGNLEFKGHPRLKELDTSLHFESATSTNKQASKQTQT